MPRRGGRLLSPFVGRQRELTSLLALLAQVEAGRGQVVGIVGEPGIGKSRLLYEFARTLRDTQVKYLEGHCFAYDQATPYGPVRGILRQLGGMTDADGPEAMTAKLRHCLHEAGLAPDTDAPYLLPLLGVSEVTTSLAEISPAVRKARTLALLRHVSLHSHQGRPRVIAVENVHWIDSTSEEYLTRLADSLSGAPLLLVTTYRPGYTPPWLDKSYTTQLAIPRLLPEDSRTVVQSVLPVAPDSGPLEQAIIESAAGNPFFLEELAWVVREGSMEQPTTMIPDTVQAVLAARIDRLPPEEKRLLQTAAVIGHLVPLLLLQSIAKLPEDVLQHGLAHLQASEFLYETHPFPDLVYTFKHALTHQVAYSSLLQARRRVLHGRIVEALEAFSADRLAEQIERLAHHAWCSEQWDKALTYLRQAGGKAMARSANREAVVCFEQALDALRHLPESQTTIAQAIDLRLDLRNALHALGESARMFAILREAEGLAESLGDHQRLASILNHQSNYFGWMGAHDRAIASSQCALTHATACGDVTSQGIIRFNLGTAYARMGDYGRAIDLNRYIAEISTDDVRSGRVSGGGFMSVLCRNVLAWTLAEQGAFAEGQAYGEDGIRLAETSEHPGSLARIYYGVGYLYLCQGVLPQAIAMLERAWHFCQAAHIALFAPVIAAKLGSAYALCGHMAEALPLLEQAVAQAATMGHMGEQAYRLVQLSQGYLLAGRSEEASDLAAHAQELARLHKERGYQAYALRLCGDLAMRGTPLEVEPAATHYRQALTLANDLGMRPLQAHCHFGLGTLYFQTGRVAQARTELSVAIDLYRSMEMIFWLPQVEVVMSQIAIP